MSKTDHALGADEFNKYQCRTLGRGPGALSNKLQVLAKGDLDDLIECRVGSQESCKTIPFDHVLKVHV